MMPERRLRNVVLPLPLTPLMPTCAPAGRVNSSTDTTTFASPSGVRKDLRSPRSSSTGGIVEAGSAMAQVRSARAVPVVVPVVDEEFLRDHAVDAEGFVHDLGHPKMHPDAREGVGVMKVVALLLLEEVHGLDHRHAHGAIEVGVQAEAKVVGRRLGARGGERLALVEDELERAGVRRLDRIDGDLAVTLRGMGVAGVEKRAFLKNRQVQRAAGDEFLAVEVAT